MKKKYLISLVFLIFLSLPVVATDLLKITENKKGDTFFLFTDESLIKKNEKIFFKYIVKLKNKSNSSNNSHAVNDFDYKIRNLVINCNNKTFASLENNKTNPIATEYKPIPLNNIDSTAYIFYKKLCYSNIDDFKKYPVLSKAITEKENNNIQENKEVSSPKTNLPDNKQETITTEKTNNIQNNEQNLHAEINQKALQNQQEEAQVKEYLTDVHSSLYDAFHDSFWMWYMENIIMPKRNFYIDGVVCSRYKVVLDKYGRLISKQIISESKYSYFNESARHAMNWTFQLNPIKKVHMNNNIEFIINFSQIKNVSLEDSSQNKDILKVRIEYIMPSSYENSY